MKIRDDSRDRDRKRDDAADPRRRRRDDSRDRANRSQVNGDKVILHAFVPWTDTDLDVKKPSQTEDEKKAERLAKLEAWKQKQAAEKDRKAKEAESTGGTKNLLAEIDKKAQASPVAVSPKSPSTPAVESGPASPAPYAGKFDPKAIAKKSAASTAAASKLGADIALPQNAKVSATVNPDSLRPQADINVAPAKDLPGKMEHYLFIATSANMFTGSVAPLKARGNVSGFGLSKDVSEPDKAAAKPGIDLAEEEARKRKLEKLPTPPPEDPTENGDVDMTNADNDEDDGDDEAMQAETEEEAAAAARLAAEKREERLKLQNVDRESEEPQAANGLVNGDVEMKEATSKDQPQQEEEDEEEADPLDAFMSGLTEKARRPIKSVRPAKKEVEAQAMFENDEIDMDAVGGEDDLLNIQSKKKKKDIPTVNHGKVKYDPFRKNFYHEPSELSELTDEDVADLRLELDGIKIRGLDVPKPVQKWSQCGLGVQSLEVIQKLGYERPSSIQAQAIPAIMSGRDVIGVAKTGSGKTVAFLLPMFRHVRDQRPLDSLEGPVGLVLAPTRELATQIHRDCKPFLKALNLRAVCAYGGAPIKDQIADLKRGAEIIVCTPGRMIDLLAANSGRVTNLKRVTYVVLDEADRMFDMGFEPQIMKILNNIRPDRQTVLFSATFPRQMESLARKTLIKPIEIVIGGRSVVAPEITQIVEVREENEKFVRLLELLGNMYNDAANEDHRTLIFVDRQESADGLLHSLMNKAYPCQSIHGGKDQIDRDSTIADFKAGVMPILIATSVAARGLDVKQLKLVVNYDAPNHLEDYVHRAGRTGRAGNTGTAVTFVTSEQDRYSVDIAKALKQSGQDVPEEIQKLVDGFMEKVKAGKEKAKGSGFGGKGLERLDQERDAVRARERKSHKMGDEPDEDEKEEDTKGDDLITKAASTVQSANAPPAQTPGVPKGIDLDGKIVVHKTEGPAASTTNNPLEKVSSAVASINARLQTTRELRSGVPVDNKGPDAGAFHATLEINDFPRKSALLYMMGTVLMSSQKKLAGLSRIERTSQKSSKLQVPRSPPRAASMRQERNHNRARIPSCISLSRAIPSWSSRTRCASLCGSSRKGRSRLRTAMPGLRRAGGTMLFDTLSQEILLLIYSFIHNAIPMRRRSV